MVASLKTFEPVTKKFGHVLVYLHQNVGHLFLRLGDLREVCNLYNLTTCIK